MAFIRKKIEGKLAETHEYQVKLAKDKEEMRVALKKQQLEEKHNRELAKYQEFLEGGGRLGQVMRGLKKVAVESGLLSKKKKGKD